MKRIREALASFDWWDIAERAWSTFWQAAAPFVGLAFVGILDELIEAAQVRQLPDFSALGALLIGSATAAIAAGLSALKNMIRQRRAA